MSKASRDKYKPTTADRNLDSFEFYMDFTDENITEEINRNPLAYFWTFGVVDEALADGADILDDEGNVIPIMQDIDAHLQETKFYQEFKQLISFARAFGKSGLLFKKSGKIRSFKPSKMQLAYDIENENFTEAILTEQAIYNDQGYFEHKAGTSAGNTFNIENDFMYVYFTEKEKTLEGRSELEPIWDILQGLFICFYLSPLIVAQTTGVKIMKSPLFQQQNKTADQKAAMLRPIRDMSHKLALGIGPSDELEIMYPPNNTFIDQTVEILFSALAAATGYPKEAWRGNQVGTTSGASQTESKILEVHKTIQKQVTPFFIEAIKKLSDIHGFVLPEKFTVEWRFKESMSEDQEAEHLSKLANAVNGLTPVFTGNEIREALGKEKLEFFDDKVPLSESQKEEIGINVTGLENEQGVMNNNEPTNQFGRSTQPTTEPTPTVTT